MIQMLLKRDSGTMDVVATWRDAGILRKAEHTTFEYIDWDRITHYYRYLTCVIAKAGRNPDCICEATRKVCHCPHVAGFLELTTQTPVLLNRALPLGPGGRDRKLPLQRVSSTAFETQEEANQRM